MQGEGGKVPRNGYLMDYLYNHGIMGLDGYQMDYLILMVI